MAFRSPPKYETNLCPPGLHPARCIGVVDLGIQETEWNKEKKEKQRICLFWEFPTLKRNWIRDDKEFEGPHMLSKSMNYSFADNATLTKLLESWRGQMFSFEERDNFDLHSVLGKTCTINVIHSPKRDGSGDSARIESVMKLIPEHRDIPNAQLPLMYYNMPEHLENIPKELPEWAILLIKSSKEYGLYVVEPESTTTTTKPWKDDDPEEVYQATGHEIEDDDIPF